MNSNFQDNDCLGAHQIELISSIFTLPATGSRADYNIDPADGNQSCSIKSAQNLYVLENNNTYEMFIGNYKITLRKE